MFNGETSLTRTSCGLGRRLLNVDDAEHLCGVAELFHLDDAHIDCSPSKVGPLCEPASRIRSITPRSAAAPLRRRLTESATLASFDDSTADMTVTPSGL